MAINKTTAIEQLRGCVETIGQAGLPRRRINASIRSREYLTADEVERLMEGARSIGRHGHRDATLILVAYRHGLRVSEVVCALGSARPQSRDAPRVGTLGLIGRYDVQGSRAGLRRLHLVTG